MATYNSLSSRTNSSALIPEEVQREIVQGTTQKSAAMQLFKTVRMGRAQQRIPVLSAYPTAYFITGSDLNSRDTGLKQTTQMQWTNVYLNAEEIAVILPVPANLVKDVDYDFWGEVKPKVTEAFGVAVDEAIFFGTNAPSTWATPIVTAANSAGNLVVAGTSSVDILDDINNVMIAVESDGYDVNGFWGRRQLRGKLRGLRTSTRDLLYVPDTGTPADTLSKGTLMGEKIIFNNAGLAGFSTSASNYSLICGDWSQGILGIREDIEMQMFDTGVITDASGAVIYNLLQQDMVALRCTARFAFAVPNPINRQNQSSSARYPFGVLQQRASTGGE